jgi:hypothetical protein
MNWDTLQWIIGVGLFVVFLFIMLRGCGGMMGGMGGCGMGMGSRREPRCRHSEEDAEHKEMSASGMTEELEPATQPKDRDRQGEQRGPSSARTME